MPETYTCAKCGKVAKTKQALERHAAYHEDDRPFSCEVCLQRFKNSDDRGKHYRRLKRDGKFEFACKVCHKHFKSPDLLSKHLEILGCLLKHAKPVDGGDITSEASAERDGQSGHEKSKKEEEILVLDNDIKCSCKVCEMKFVGTDNLKNHYKTEHGDSKRQVCIQCGQTLSSKDSLARHYSIFHQNEYPFQCDLCDQKFKIKESLCRHVKFVHKDGGYPCEICQRVFTQPVNLKKHMAMHSSAKEFSCSICGREFRWKQALQKHMILHGNASLSKAHNSIQQIHREQTDHTVEKTENSNVIFDSAKTPGDDLQRPSVSVDSSIGQSNKYHNQNSCSGTLPMNRQHRKMTKTLDNLAVKQPQFELSRETGKQVFSEQFKSSVTQNQISDINDHLKESENLLEPVRSNSALNDLANIITSFAATGNKANLDNQTESGETAGGTISHKVHDTQLFISQAPALNYAQQNVLNDDSMEDCVSDDDETDEMEIGVVSEAKDTISSYQNVISNSTVGIKHKMSFPKQNFDVQLNWKKARMYGREVSQPIGKVSLPLSDSYGSEGVEQVTYNEKAFEKTCKHITGENRSSQNVDINKETENKQHRTRKEYESFAVEKDIPSEWDQVSEASSSVSNGQKDLSNMEDILAKEKEKIYTSVPTREDSNAPRYVFKPSSLPEILGDKSKESTTLERYGSPGEAINRKAEIKDIMEAAATTPKRTNNPFLIPYSAVNSSGSGEASCDDTRSKSTCKIVHSDKIGKPVPQIQGLYKFSLVKHMLSLKNEENFDKNIFRNPLYSSQADIKDLTNLVERHRVENGSNLYDLSARQICPFQWLGVKVNKNKDDNLSDSEGLSSPVNDLDCMTPDSGKNDDIDIELNDDDSKSSNICGSENGLNRQKDWSLSKHSNCSGVNPSDNRLFTRNANLNKNKKELDNDSSDSSDENLEPDFVSSPHRSPLRSAMPIRGFQIMKDLVKSSKYALVSKESNMTHSFSVLRNPFEVSDVDISRCSVKSKETNQLPSAQTVSLVSQCLSNEIHELERTPDLYTGKPIYSKKEMDLQSQNVLAMGKNLKIMTSEEITQDKKSSPHYKRYETGNGFLSNLDFDSVASPPTSKHSAISSSNKTWSLKSSRSSDNEIETEIAGKIKLTSKFSAGNYGSNTYPVPLSFTQSRHVTSLVTKTSDDVLPENIAQGLNDVLCSSLQNDLDLVSKIPGASIVSRTRHESTQVCDQNTAAGAGFDQSRTVEYSVSGIKSDACHYSVPGISKNRYTNNGTESVGALNLVNRACEQQSLSFSGSYCPTKASSLSGSTKTWCRSMPSSYGYGTSSVEKYGANAYGQKGVGDNIMPSKSDVSVLDLLKFQGDKVKEFEPLDKFFDSCI